MDPTKRNNVSSLLRCALLSFFEQKDFSGETRARRIDLEGSEFSVTVVVYIHIYIYIYTLIACCPLRPRTVKKEKTMIVYP